MEAIDQRIENCSTLPKYNLKSYNWLGISADERNLQEKNCYYKKKKVDKIIDDLEKNLDYTIKENNTYKAEVNQLRGELNDCEKKVKTTMQDVYKQEYETYNDYIERIEDELYDKSNRRFSLITNYMNSLHLRNPPPLPQTMFSRNPPPPPQPSQRNNTAKGIINKNQKKKRKSNKKKRKLNKKRNNTKKSK